MITRTYSQTGPTVLVLHGGPAAAGEAEPLARGLAANFRVLEPWQRGSGDTPLTVATHIADLHPLLQTQGAEPLPALVGESWGAMLALAVAAAYPTLVGPIALVGCGTFDTASRARLNATLEERTTTDLRKHLDDLRASHPPPSDILLRTYRLLEPLFSYDVDASEQPPLELPFDERAHQETWDDMLRLQREGLYPAAFRAITSPVLMLHGSFDPHPGQMIRASLEPHIPQLQYREWDKCGHKPWLERQVRDEFFSVLRDWLLTHTSQSPQERFDRSAPS